MFIFPTFLPFFIRKVLFCPESDVKSKAHPLFSPDRNRGRNTRSYPILSATKKWTTELSLPPVPGFLSPPRMAQGLHPCLWSFRPFRTPPPPSYYLSPFLQQLFTPYLSPSFSNFSPPFLLLCGYLLLPVIVRLVFDRCSIGVRSNLAPIDARSIPNQCTIDAQSILSQWRNGR